MAVCAREFRLALRRPGDALGALFFFVLVGSLFPLAVGPDVDLLHRIAPGVIWVAALLSILLGQHRLFEPDLADGTLEQWRLSSAPLPLLAGLKTLSHWLLTAAPLLLVTPLLGWQYGLADNVMAVMLASLLLGTPSLCLLAALGAALTLGLKGQLLLVLVVMPLCIPVLVFGSDAVARAAQGLSAAPSLSLLGALLCLTILACPWAIAAALRLALE